MDALSELVTHAEFRLQEVRVHTFDGGWAFDLSLASPSLFLIRRGRCAVWPAGARHSLSLSDGYLLLVSGEQAGALQALGPRIPAPGPYPWEEGLPLDRTIFLPESPTGAQILSARVHWVQRSPIPLSFPSLLCIGPGRVALTHGRSTLHQALVEELLAARQGTEVLVCRVLEAMVIRGLRSEISSGFWSVQGWLGALTDPVLRTGLAELRAAGTSSVPSVRRLADSSNRSVRRLSSRVKALSGTRPSKLLLQLRMQRVLRRLDQSTPDLHEVARECGYADVSSLCRAFRRAVGCSPAEYWRRRHGRPFPRPGKSPDRAPARS